MLSAITFTTGLILVAGICNDRATLTQVIFYATLGFALMLLSVLFTKHQQYKLEFIAPNGNHKIIYAYNLAGKILATRKYTKMGYKIQTEWEIIK